MQALRGLINFVLAGDFGRTSRGHVWETTGFRWFGAEDARRTTNTDSSKKYVAVRLNRDLVMIDRTCSYL